MANMYKIYNDNQENHYEKIMAAKQLERTFIPITKPIHLTSEVSNVGLEPDNTALDLETSNLAVSKQLNVRRRMDVKKDTYFRKLRNYFDLN